MNHVVRIDRRKFLGGLVKAGGLLLGAGLAPDVVARPAKTGPPKALHPGLFLSLATDGTVTILAHRSEMGTGIRTCLPMVVAEELGADWSRVKIEQAPGDAKYGSQDTDGSRSIRDFYQTMREAGATARAMLERAAAAELGVTAEECVAREHQVFHTASGRSIPFGQLVATAARLPVPPLAALRFRKPADYRYVGKSVPIFDRADILTGKAVFGMDVRLDGMKYAAVKRPPVVGGTVVSYDAKECLAVPGVEKVVVLPNACSPYGFSPLGGVAVIARDTWSAFKGCAKLKVKFKFGENASYDSTAYRARLEASVREPGRVIREHGAVDTALETSHHVHEAVYYVPHLAHASMEPPVATAHVTGNRCEVWAPTQNPQAARNEVAKALGFRKAHVTVHVTLLGGGFGRKSKPDFIVEAALLSRKVAAPVKVVWSREDDLQHDYYHSVSAQYFKAGLDARGLPVAWLQRTAFPPIRSTFLPQLLPMSHSPSDGELAMGFTDVPFAVPHLRCEKHGARAHARIGWFRSVANLQHAFAAGSFVGELAILAKRDPLEYLLHLIGPARHLDLDGANYDNMEASLATYPVDTGRLREVTKIAARSADWGRELPRGSGLGIACHRSFLSYVATVVEVAVSPSGELRIPRVDVAIDCGRIINPDRVRAQMEGATVFAASLARTGEITMKGGAVEQSNFNDYRVARIHEAPRDIRVTLVASDAPPAGVGEPGVPPFAAALANAVHVATGKRIRSLPFSRHDLSWS